MLFGIRFFLETYISLFSLLNRSCLEILSFTWTRLSVSSSLFRILAFISDSQFASLLKETLHVVSVLFPHVAPLCIGHVFCYVKDLDMLDDLNISVVHSPLPSLWMAICFSFSMFSMNFACKWSHIEVWVSAYRIDMSKAHLLLWRWLCFVAFRFYAVIQTPFRTSKTLTDVLSQIHRCLYSLS